MWQHTISVKNIVLVWKLFHSISHSFENNEAHFCTFYIIIQYGLRVMLLGYMKATTKNVTKNNIVIIMI